jgi:hypothetical protein
MLQEIGSKDRILDFIARAKDKDDPFRLMGFGHRVYAARCRPGSFEDLEWSSGGAGQQLVAQTASGLSGVSWSRT